MQVITALFASVVDLDKPGHYVHWWVIQLSLANLVVIALMVLVFLLALVVPFPTSHRSEREKDPRR